jgi:hypothetical protein
VAGQPDEGAGIQPGVAQLFDQHALVERLHDDFVGADLTGPRRMRRVVVEHAEHDFRLGALRHGPDRAHDVEAVALRQPAIEQDRVRHVGLAGFDDVVRMRGVRDVIGLLLENAPRDLANDRGIIRDEAAFHDASP